MPWVNIEPLTGPQLIGDPKGILQHQVCGFCQARYLRSILQTQCQLCAEEKGREFYVETCERCDPDGDLHDELLRAHYQTYHGQTEDT
jgi:hypothetical protein